MAVFAEKDFQNFATVFFIASVLRFYNKFIFKKYFMRGDRLRNLNHFLYKLGPVLHLCCVQI